jgi:hypothetical protein
MKMAIEVETVRCAIEVLAMPGDLLAILHGVVVGVIPEDHSTTSDKVCTPVPTRTFFDEDVIEFWLTHGPSTVRTMNKRLGHNTRECAEVKNVVARLFNSGKFRRMNSSRFPVYAVVEPIAVTDRVDELPA